MDTMNQWVIETMAQFGYPGLFLLMVAENVFPPIPSEVIIPFAGFAAGQGVFELWLVVAVGLAGSLVGNLPWFYLARLLGEDRLVALTARFGRFVMVAPDDVQAAISWFNRHGPTAVLLARLVPGVRTLISVPAGLTRMSLASFLLYSALGSVVWIGALAGLGYALGDHWPAIEGYVGPLGAWAVGACAVAGVAFVAIRHWRRRRDPDAR